MLDSLLSPLGESDPGPGASPPDEPLPGQAHDHPQRGDVPEGGPDRGRREATLPAPPELLAGHPGRGGQCLFTMKCYVVVVVVGWCTIMSTGIRSGFD